jgi:hypothetical protein
VVIVGAILDAGKVTVTDALLPADTSPPASFAQAKSVLVPAEKNAYEVDALLVQALEVAEGGVELSVTI